MRFAILLLLTLGLVIPAAQAAQPITPKLNSHIAALDNIAICKAVTSIEQRPAFKKISEGTLPNSELQSLEETMAAHELLFSQASLLHVEKLTAALIVDNQNIFNDLEEELERKFAQAWDEVDAFVAKGKDLSNASAGCHKLIENYDRQLKNRPTTDLFSLEDAQRQKVQTLLNSTLSDTRCALVTDRAKQLFGSDEHAMVELFDIQRKRSLKSYLAYLEEVIPSRSSEALESLAATQIMTHLVSLSDHWDETDDTARKEWVSHCRQIQKSSSN